MQDMLFFYGSIGTVIATIIGVIYYKFFRRVPEILATPPKLEKAEAAKAKAAAEKISKETAETKSVLNNAIVESDKHEAVAEASFEKAKENIYSGNLSEIKKYLKAEGYNVNEIFPE